MPARRSRALALLRASHPGPVVAVTALTTALAVTAGLGARSVAVAAALGSGQLAIGWTNDVLDAARDRVAGRTDKPVATGEVEGRTVRAAAVAAAVCCVPLSLLLGLDAGLLHLAAVGSGLLYDGWAKRTLLSWVPYAVSFAALPSIVTLALPGPAWSAWAPWWATVAAGLLGVGAHLLNALPDLAADRATGVVALPHRIGARASRLLGALTMQAAVVLLVVAPPGRAGGAAWVAAGAATVAAAGAVRGRPDTRTPFRLAIVVAALAVALLVARGSALSGA